MDEKLQSLKKLVSSFTLTRDIEDVVFDYNGQKGVYPHNCPGKCIIQEYNEFATRENTYSYNKCNQKQLINMPPNTICFWINGYINPTHSYPDSITSYYFKEFMIIKTQLSSQGHWVCRPATYKFIRHYFTPDILLVIKRFSRIENHEDAMNYIRQNPHYFKHHTVDSIEIFKKANEIIKEIIEELNTKLEYFSQLEQKVKDLEEQNQTLQNIINNMEENNKTSESPIKLKLE
jgi:hypothetical protein